MTGGDKMNKDSKGGVVQRLETEIATRRELM
jgi:hypothetical protein